MAPFEHAARVWTEREQVYRAWLARELMEGATIEEDRLVAFQRTAMRRRAGEARRHVIERPDAILEGVIRISNAERFRARLKRGIGRHRAYGFGMLLLRPAGRSASPA